MITKGTTITRRSNDLNFEYSIVTNHSLNRRSPHSVLRYRACFTALAPGNLRYSITAGSFSAYAIVMRHHVPEWAMHKHLGAFGVDEAKFAKVLEADVDVGTGGADYIGQDLESYWQ